MAEPLRLEFEHAGLDSYATRLKPLEAKRQHGQNSLRETCSITFKSENCHLLPLKTGRSPRPVCIISYLSNSNSRNQFTRQTRQLVESAGRSF